MITIDRLSEQEVLTRLAFVLDKVEWDSKEMQWLLAYIEQTDGTLLQQVLLAAFLDQDEMPERQEVSFAQKRIKRKIDRQLFE